MADREAWFGDAGDPLDVAALLAPAYVAERRALIADTASPDLRPGRLGGRDPRLADLAVDGSGVPA